MVTLKQIMYDVQCDCKLSDEVRERIWNNILIAISEWKKDRMNLSGNNTYKGDDDNGSK